jgi:hypothetical protein
VLQQDIVILKAYWKGVISLQQIKDFRSPQKLVISIFSKGKHGHTLPP